PNYDFPENFNDLQNIDEDWIIVFILRFQTRFRLPDIAIDTLIKFIKHVLTELDHEQFKNFPTSLYTTRKKLKLKHQFVTFSVCSSCHKLHNIDDVEQHTICEQKVIKKCDHIQFPNNHHHSLRKCDTLLSEQKELGGNKIVNSPLLIYPIARSLPNSRQKIESEIMRFMMQSSQIKRKFNMLPLNRQSIFQILNLENDQSVDKSESFESEELQAFLNISK
ncbi:11921_t:CDS:2, partial [Funneliformis caledonium]